MSEEQRYARLHSYLMSLVLMLIAAALVAWIRFTFVLTDEVHQTRVEIAAQLSAVNTAIQTSGSRLDSRSQDISNVLHTFGKRMDSNITDTRATIQNIGKSAQASTAKQIKETGEVLNEKLGEATQNLAVVAEKAAEPDKPVQVNVPAPVFLPPVAIPEKSITPPVQKPEPKKKRGFWKRILPPWN